MDRVTAAKVFVDVAHSGSFTATGERLNMSRPMVTRYIEAMEDWFNQRLLHRTTRKVSLTTAGELCLPNIEQWLDTIDNMVGQVAPVNELAGSIRIATSMSFGHSQLIVALSDFMQKHPKVCVDIDLQDSTADLVKSRIDLAIRIAANPAASLIGKPIAKCHSVLVASKAYMARQPSLKQPDDLSAHQCLGYSNFDQHIWHLNQRDKHRSVAVNCRLSANEATTLMQACLCDAGIAMLPTYLVNPLIADGSLSRVLPEWTPNEMNIYVLYSSRKHLPATVRALIDFLSVYFNAHPWE
ncbi:LysR family transcriptional regulator [Agarivorans sp. MS3-6]|uniref:LysR family transcriptional regulator n=1 Tax=Agarivorans sp. TSD2052 TaxID=2937286 RepID=UPI00200CAC8C|nr:LysR family transcriptional regulator [Agarivorans sp. TSD2052]UPW19843.1 LysR family transcriptional regulator [Agarivorans sp. TSD2052]